MKVTTWSLAPACCKTTSSDALQLLGRRLLYLTLACTKILPLLESPQADPSVQASFAALLSTCAQATHKTSQAKRMLSLCWRNCMLTARQGRHKVQHMARANQHSFLHGEDSSASVANIAASVAAQFKQHRENKTRTLAQSKEPALRCFPGAAQALAAAASTLRLVGLTPQSQETGSLCVCQTWQANISLVASKRGLPKARNRHDPAAIV